MGNMKLSDDHSAHAAAWLQSCGYSTGSLRHLTCCASEKPYSFAMASMAMLSTMRSMLHSANERAKGMVSLVKEPSARSQKVFK